MNKQFDDIYILTGQSIRKKNPAAIRRSLSDAFAMIANDLYQHIEKTDRWFFSQSSTQIRPTTETPYSTWSGVTVIDLDIKNANAALEVKKRLAKLLSKQAWFAGIVLSTSHKGVHIYTACKPDVALMDKDVYLDNAEAMSIHVWHALLLAYTMATAESKTGKCQLDNSALLDMHPVMNMSSRRELKNGQLSESRMFDTSIFKLTQPTLFGYDPEPFLNDDFELQPPLALTEHSYDGTGYDELRAMFDKLRGREIVEQSNSVQVGDVQLPTVEQCRPRSYDNTARYRLAYTLANLYDIASHNNQNYKLLKQCFLKMCSGNPKYNREKRAFEAVFDSAVQRQATGMCPKIAWAINELRTVHGFAIEVLNEAEIQQQILDIDINVELSKPVLIPPELQLVYDNIWDLADGQYIADATDILLQDLRKARSKTLLIAEPGTGKTVFATNLMQHSELRILCIVPYISVIESKFKTLPPEANCQCCYGMNSYDVTLSRNAVMTFDKFSRMSMNDIDMCFDLVVLDESHLLQMSSYRSLVPAECVDRLRDCNTPTVLMTGTPIAEHMFITFTKKVLFKRKRATSKLFNIVICNNSTERLGHACLHIANSIRAGRRIIFPTNEGNMYVQKVVAGVQSILQRQVIWQYYKKEFAEEAFMFEVNRKQTIGDIELLFCSAYLSVGVDINDLDKFDIVYTEDFTAHEIEQFNNRLRRVDLASYYFVAKFANNGYVNPNCYSSMLPNLRVSKVRQLELQDLLAIHTIQADEDGKVAALFDYFRRHLNMPWLLKQPNGEVKLHSTCYALWTFEDTWRKWAVQLPILVDQLRQYNYQIDVINTELLDNDSLADILDATREGLHDYKDRVNSDLQFVIELMQNKDFYDVMTYSNAIRLQRHKYQALEVFDDHIVLSVQNVPPVHRFMRSVRMLSKYYTRKTVLSLYDKANCQLSKFEHVCSTVNLLDYAANDRLTNANVDVVRYILHVMFDGKTECKMSKLQYLTHLQRIVDVYQQLYDLQSATILDKLHQHADGMIKRLAEKVTNQRGDTVQNIWQLRKIPAFDSSAKLNLEAQKAMMYAMFKASLFDTNKQKTSDETDKFFEHNDKITESDNVDLIASIKAISKLQVAPKISNVDVQMCKAYIAEKLLDATTMDFARLLKQLVLDSPLSYIAQLERLIPQYIKDFK